MLQQIVTDCSLVGVQAMAVVVERKMVEVYRDRLENWKCRSRTQPTLAEGAKVAWASVGAVWE